MSKNKVLIILPFLILILLLNGCKEKQSSKKENVKVLAIMSLSGEAKSFGKSSKNALELLSKDLDKKGIQIIYLDDESNKEKVEDSLKKILGKEKIKAIILCTQDNSAEAVTRIAAENEIIVINATATDTTLDKVGKDFIYSLSYSNEFEGNALAKFTYEKLKFSKAAILYNEDKAYSKDLTNFYKTSFEKLGGTVATQSSYKNNTQDYSEVLKKIKDSKFDVIFIPDYYYNVKNIVKQIRSSGINTVLMGGDGWDSGEILTISEFQGSYFSSQFMAKDSIPGTIEFKKSYEETYKSMPDARAVLSYDAGKVIMSIFGGASKGENPEKIKETLSKMTMEGVSGNISFNQDKRGKKVCYIVEVTDKTLNIITKILP
ncbi:MAG: ABC transporter substrate-binding protein [Clostridiaceae bacterium]|nr:ABC transporter substrate-binding protein [Clostridiaceae bacterium]